MINKMIDVVLNESGRVYRGSFFFAYQKFVCVPSSSFSHTTSDMYITGWEPLI